MPLKFLKKRSVKIIISILLSFLYLIIVSYVSPKILCDCIDKGLNNCKDYYSFLLIKSIECHCSCISLSTVLIEYINYLIIPFITIYIFYSIFVWLISKHKK